MIKRHTQVMGLFESWLFARVAWLLAMIILVWVGTFLTLLATQETNGDWHPLDPIYLAISAEEAEEVDEHPVDADLLSALLLLALSFWATLVWLLTNDRGHRAFRLVGLGRWFLSALEHRSFLGVFRL